MKPMKVMMCGMWRRVGVVPFACFMLAVLSASAACEKCITTSWDIWAGCRCAAAPHCIPSTVADKCTYISIGLVFVNCYDSMQQVCATWGPANCRTDDGGSCDD